MILVLAIYSVTSLVKLGSYVEQIYQGPLKTISYSRSAQVNFILMRNAYSTIKHNTGEIDEEEMLDLLSEHYDIGLEDLNVVKEWSRDEKSLQVMDEIIVLATQAHESLLDSIDSGEDG